ncbi:hypothetical protein D1872_294030 [compost metagenome]
MAERNNGAKLRMRLMTVDSFQLDRAPINEKDSVYYPDLPEARSERQYFFAGLDRNAIQIRLLGIP